MMLDFNDAPLQTEHKPQKHQYTIEEIEDAILKQFRNYVLYLFPHARINRGQARIGSLNGEPGESLSISLDGPDAGQWIDHNTDDRGNAIQLWQQCDGLSFGDAVTEIKKWLGLKDGALKTSPKQAVRKNHKSKPPEQLGSPDFEYHYKDAEDKIIATVKRYNLADGKKTFRVWDAVAGKAQQPTPKPLYNIPGIIDNIDNDHIIFAEGEKAADHLNALGYTATTLMSGGNSKLDKTDFSHIIGKSCLLWRDNDPTGLKWQNTLLPHLEMLGCAVRTLKIPHDMPEKGDAADCTHEQIKNIIQTKRFILKKAGEIKNTPPPKFIIDGFIVENSLASIIGPSGSGKSFVALDIALNAVHGLKWHSKTVKPSSCVYIAAEGAAGIASRINAFDTKFKVDSDKRDFWLLPSTVNLVDPATDVPDLIATLDEAQPDIIIIDTLARSFAGGEENSAKDMSLFISNCGKLQERYSATVIIIHHTGKDTDRGGRGSSALKAALDTEFTIKRIEGTEHLSFINSKQKDTQEAFTMHFRLASIEVTNPVTGEIETSCTVTEDETIFAGRRQKLSDNQREILSVLEKEKLPQTVQNIVEKSGISETTVKRFLKDHSKGPKAILVLGSGHTEGHTGPETYLMKTIGYE